MSAYIYKCPFSEKFDSFEKIDFTKYSGNIVTWGAGRIGGIAMHCLKQRNINVLATVDISKEKQGTEICGVRIISPEELKEKYLDCYVIVTAVVNDQIVQRLKEMGFDANKIFNCVSLFMEIDFNEYDFWMKERYAIRNVEQYLNAIYSQEMKHEIDQIFLNITTRCSLNCKECCALIPNMINPIDFNQNDIMKDLFTVLDCVGKVRVVNFLGGEPMLHPNLDQMIARLKHESRIDRITIVTNGTIIPSNRLLDAMEDDERIWVRISDYGTLSKNKDIIVKKLEERNIFYDIANYEYWDQGPKIGRFDETEEKLINKFRMCTSCNIVYIMNSKMYMCAPLSAGDYLGVFPKSESNYIDLRDKKGFECIKEKVTTFMDRREKGDYFDGCRYCSGNHCILYENKQPVAVQAKSKFELSPII